MKSQLSLEGLRPPLSRDSSTYTHAMSYFACMVVLEDVGPSGSRSTAMSLSQAGGPHCG